MSGWTRTSALGVTASSAELEAVKRQLAPGEHIEWIGRPDPKKWLSPDDGLIAPLAFVAFCAGILLEVFAMQAQNDGWVFGVVLLFTWLPVTGYFAFGYILYRVYRKRRTTYVVTNRRVLSIIRGVGGDTVEAADLGALPIVSPDS